MSKQSKRSSRRNRRRGGNGAAPAPERKVNYRKLVNPFEPHRYYSDDQIQSIHDHAKAVVQDFGIKVLHDEARQIFKEAGALVDEDTLMVCIGGDIIDAAVASAPPECIIAGAGEAEDIPLGRKSVVWAPVGGPPHVSDLERSKQPGTLKDYTDFIKLSEHFDVIHLQGAPVEPQDIETPYRHLEMMRACFTLSNKAPFLYSRGSPQVADGLAMVKLARGLSDEEFAEKSWVWTVINTNSPRQLDIPMCQGIIDFARARQLTLITPFTLAGAMAPITIAGACVLQHAEFLAGLVLHQLSSPGAPVCYGAFTSNVDMKTGSPAFGTPEYMKAAWITGQLARLVDVPWRSSAPTASNCADAQAAYESMLSLWAALQSGAQFTLHAAGWLEGGLTASLEKFILDVEVLQMVAEVCQPAQFEEADLAMDAIRDVEPGGHFFGCDHTMARYQTAFYKPLVSDWNNFGLWTETGAKTATQRANEIWKQTLADFRSPVSDPAVGEALDAFVAKRTEEGGAPPI